MDAVPTASLEDTVWRRRVPGWSRRPSSTAARRTDAAELPVCSECGRDDLFGRTRLRSDVVADRDVALDDRVAKDPEPLDLDLHHVAGFDRPVVRRFAGQDDVA